MSNEPIEELTEQDIADLELLQEDANPGAIIRQPLLVIWRELLSNIDTERNARITLAQAQKITSTWPQLEYGDVPAYLDMYYEFLQEMRGIVLAELDSDPKAEEQFGDDDAVENRQHYINILFNWNLATSRWEKQWNTTAHNAAIGVAAIVDAHSFFLSQTGLVAHLNEIGFQFTEEDSAKLAQELAEAEAEL